MKSNELFNGLHGCQNIHRSEIIDIIELAKQENNTDVIYRLSKILNANPDADIFNIEIRQFTETGLNGSRHTGDYKEALDECGRLNKGFRFENGKVVKVVPKEKPVKKTATKTPKVKKTASNYGKKTKRSNKEKFLELVSNEKSNTLEKIKERKENRVKKETPAVEKSTENEYPFSKSDIPLEVGKRAHYWTSFTPEKRAEQEQHYYFNALKNIYDKYSKIAIGKDGLEKFETLFSKFKDKYLTLKLAELNAKSRTASTMITGGSNFNVRKNQKALNSHQNKYQQLIDFEKKYIDIFDKIFFPNEQPIKTGKTGSLNKLEEKLIQLEESQKRMVKANAELRKIKAKKLSVTETINEYKKYLSSVGYTQEMIKDIVSISERNNNLIWLGFNTTNSGAEIRRIKDRIAVEKKLKEKAETAQENDNKFEFSGGYIINDFNDNRVKIHFDSVPSVEIRNFIKKSGQAFKWSPFNKVWQRQLNTYWSGSRKDLYTFLGVKNDEKKVVSNQDNQLKLLGTKKQKPALKSAVQENSNVNKNSLAYRLQNKGNVKHEYYIIPDKEISNFLGQIEKKNKESVAITIAGGQGSMKTRLCFQLMNAFAQNYKVGHASIEEHPESKLYEDKIHQYLNNKALNNIVAPEIENINDVHKLCRENDVIVIDSFSKLQEMQKGCELDKDFRKAYDGKLFIIIYQLTGDGKMRGGSKSQFDGDIISFVKKEDNYKDNYCYHDKNRYNNANLEDLKFNIFSGKINQTEAQKQEVQPKETIQFSFNVK